MNAKRGKWRTCPCPCRQRFRAIRTGSGKPKRYATRWCVHRLRPVEERRHGSRQGGLANARNFEGRLIEKLVNLDLRSAILRAYRLGQRSAYNRNQRARMKTGA